MTAQFEFRCLAFHEGLALGRAPGRLYVDHDFIEFVVGENNGNMSLQGLQVQAGGTANRQIIVTHPIWRGWTFQTSNRAFLQNPFLRSHPAINYQIDDIRRKRRIGLICWIVVLLAILLTPLYLLTRLEAVNDRLSHFIPPSWQSTLGMLGLEHYRHNRILLDIDQTAPLLQPFTVPLHESLSPSAPGELKFYLVVDKDPYAFALPGGIIIIHTGLIKSVGSPAEFTALLAHEISHVTQQHGIRNLLVNSGLPTLVAAVVGDMIGWRGASAAVAQHLLDPQYSPRLETEADVYAYNLLKRARLPSTGLHELFESLASTDQVDSSTYLAAHPVDTARLNHLQSLTSEAVDREKQQNFATGFDLLIQGVRELETRAQSIPGPDDAG